MYKQVIVIRKDLKMRRGKEISQGSHASGMWMMKKLLSGDTTLSEAQRKWAESGMFTKVTVVVNSESELKEIHEKAIAAGLDCNLITDAGKTEFNGVPTETCLCIGPDDNEKINTITGHLTLY